MNYKSVYKLKHILLTIYLQNMLESFIFNWYNKEKRKKEKELVI